VNTDRQDIFVSDMDGTLLGPESVFLRIKN